MKPLFFTLALLASMKPMWAQTNDAPTQTTSQTAPKPVTLDNGLVVTPVIVPRDDVRDMLDVKMWRFNIKPPVSDTNFQAQMELRTTGKPTDKMNSIGIALPDEIELTFGILPKGGSMFSNAETWRIHFAMRRLSGQPFFSPSGSDRINPIKDIQWTRGTDSGSGGSAAKPLPNGDIPLMGFQSGTKENPILTELVLVLTATKPPEPPKP